MDQSATSRYRVPARCRPRIILPESSSSAVATAYQTTGTEYKICVSETPALLEHQVNDLLSRGWELHGYPFVDLRFQGNGNGSGRQLSGNVFCQAVVRYPGYRSAELAEAAHGDAPVGQEPAALRRPRVAPSFRGVAVFLAVLAGGYLLAECLLFRSGFYTRFLEPESTTGSFERTFRAEKNRAPSRKKEVLLVGSSRIAEGFSAKLANQYKPEDGYLFFNCAVPSATARTLFYMVRDLDPHRNRYAAIAIPIDDYDDPDDTEDVADRAGDLRLVVNRLHFTDILPYTLSFTTRKSRREVFRGALLTGTVYQLDLADFIEHPTERLARVKMFRESGDSWAYDYNGIDHNLAGMTVDWVNRRATFPPGMPPDTQRFFEQTFFHKAPQHGKMRAFEVRWLGALADLYRGSKTRIVFFQAPRGPVHGPTPRLPWTSVDELRKRPWISIVDQHRFESLERPELFADYVHLSTDGRKIFSPMLADAVKETLH
jgi:hypothetical protein